MIDQWLAGPKVMLTHDWTFVPVLCHCPLELRPAVPFLCQVLKPKNRISRSDSSTDLWLDLANGGHWRSTQRQEAAIQGVSPPPPSTCFRRHLQKELHLLQGTGTHRVLVIPPRSWSFLRVGAAPS